MCGIVGIVGSFSAEQCREILQKMNDTIVHRGPDDKGIWAEDGFGFAMRRLSIIDLEGGHQPMWDENSGLGVVFNGEVFNYRAVKERLSKEGLTFRTSSDTEVVLQSLVALGTEGIHSWNGMFAVAAWNRQEKKLLLIRDRMGVKPLYYFWDGRVFLFASEIKAILASGVVSRTINRRALWDYLTFRYVPGPYSIWTGIQKLEPGQFLEFSFPNEPATTRYWELDVRYQDGSANPKTEEELDEEFAELFLDAVKLRLEASDVPVGVLLSGGLDSSSVAAAAVELGHRNFHTFSVGFEEGGYYSELPYARVVAKHVGARYHEVVIGQGQFLEMLPDLVYHTDEPLADLAAIPLLAVSRLAQQHVKVVLSGEGSDEILAGYDLDLSERRWALVRSLQRIPKPLMKLASKGSRILPDPFSERTARVAELPLAAWNQRELPYISRYLDQDEKSLLWPGGNNYPSSDQILINLYESAGTADPLEQMLFVFQKSWLVEDLLMKADKMSMAASVELRTPFLDYRLVGWANRQPKFVKLKRTGLRSYETKSVLRRFCTQRLPRDILTRTKRGFPVPVNKWLQSNVNSWARKILLGSDSRVSRAFSTQTISNLLLKAQQGSGEAAGKTWLLIVLEFWLRTWNANIE